MGSFPQSATISDCWPNIAVVALNDQRSKRANACLRQLCKGLFVPNARWLNLLVRVTILLLAFYAELGMLQ